MRSASSTGEAVTLWKTEISGRSSGSPYRKPSIAANCFPIPNSHLLLVLIVSIETKEPAVVNSKDRIQP